MEKRSYVFAGASQRAFYMYMRPMKEQLAEYCTLSGVYDINPGRAGEIAGRVGIPVFADFDTMIRETKPDCVIVTTVDVYHSDYIIRALELGCDVLTEKPMTVDAKRCNAILEAERRTGKSVVVAFNYRFAPFMTKIKQLLGEGAVGDIFSIHFEWLLDRNMNAKAHGTSYFRRWNSRMEKSGGLLVHKSTHHFDLVNWWIGQKPESVSAFARLNLYGKTGSETYAGGISGKNCRNCPHKKACTFYRVLTETEMRIYADNEQYDGYYKDGCVYASDIDIYDTMGVTVKYDKGAIMTYSLNATCAYEGWRMAVNGSKGRLEAYLPESGPDLGSSFDTIRVFDCINNVTEHRIARTGGGHGGGDERLRRMLFVGDLPDPLGHMANATAGMESVIIGAAANISISEKRMVDIADLL